MAMTSERKSENKNAIFRAFWHNTREKRQPERETTMCTVFDAWLADLRPRVKPSTYATYEGIVERHLRPEFGELTLSELSDNDVLLFLTSLSGEGSGLSRSTVQMISTVLKGILSEAAMQGAAVHPELCRASQKSAKSGVCVLTEDEQRRLLDLLGPKPRGKDLGILLSLRTGLRVGEVCALRWGDISPDCTRLRVCRTVQRINDGDGGTRLYFGAPKSSDSLREIPLSPSLCALLGELRGNDGDFIVSDRPDGTVEPRTMQRHFKSVLRRAGIRDLNFHVLRHTFATRCVERGFDVKSLSMILGHADVKTTMNIYVHPSFERLQDMMSSMD